MSSYSLINRRMAVADLGRAGLAIMVFGLAACADDGSAGGSATSGARASGSSPDPTEAPSGTTASTSAVRPTKTDGSASAAVTDWHRAALGGVSAYVLYRNGEGALVDTGNPGDEGAIEDALTEVGLGWNSIGHVIVTHKHGDHQGSAEAVAALAPAATFYVGAADAPSIVIPVSPVIVQDGDSVFDLSIIETPGHTPGHISVHEPMSGILVAGDAMNGAGSGVAGSDSGVGGANPRFTENMDEANDSIRKMAGLSFEVVLFGHGEPLLSGGSAAVEALAETLG